MSTTISNSVNQQIEIAINHNPHLLKDKLHFTPKDGRVLLSGQVNSYFEKQMAQEVLRNIDGVSEIQNELTVDWS